MEYKDPGRYIPILYLLYSWGSRFGVPSRVPLPKTKPECAFAKVAVIGLAGLRLCARGHDVSGWLLSFWAGFRV